jgi:hypothetical protein
MTEFTVYTPENALEAANPSLKAAKASFGFIPNVQAAMIETEAAGKQRP